MSIRQANNSNQCIQAARYMPRHGIPLPEHDKADAGIRRVKYLTSDLCKLVLSAENFILRTIYKLYIFYICSLKMTLFHERYLFVK